MDTTGAQFVRAVVRRKCRSKTRCRKGPETYKGLGVETNMSELKNSIIWEIPTPSNYEAVLVQAVDAAMSIGRKLKL